MHFWWLIFPLSGVIGGAVRAVAVANDRRAERRLERYRIKQQTKIAVAEAAGRGRIDSDAERRTMVKVLAQHDDMLRSILQSAPVALRGLANATGTGNAADLNVPNGLLADSWMCAISGRAKQFNFLQYFQDCK